MALLAAFPPPFLLRFSRPVFTGEATPLPVQDRGRIPPTPPLSQEMCKCYFAVPFRGIYRLMNPPPAHHPGLPLPCIPHGSGCLSRCQWVMAHGGNRTPTPSLLAFGLATYRRIKRRGL